MWKIVGMVFVLGGAAGVLYSWVCEQREKQKRLEDFMFFLQKSIFIMETEKIRIVDYFRKSNEDTVLEQTLQEIATRLATNTYPNGQMVWEEVFYEQARSWNLSQEVFSVVVQAGNGFFGRSREENISFLKKSLKELEKQQANMKEKDAQERKVWVPVGMLGTVMLVILFL